VTRPTTFGVDGLALTPERKIVLVRLTYAKGWHLPGGRRKRREDPLEAVRRELREEIGMYDCSSIEFIDRFSQRKHYKHDTVSMFLARDVEYSPGWSLEVEAVEEFDLDELPHDARHARKWVAELKLRGHLE
jgi:ADP-ribose pyrophosphatase YjhB (NUDIX family)